MNEIRVELDRATHDADIDALRERRARLSSRLAVIRVGGATDDREQGEAAPHRGLAIGGACGDVRGDRRPAAAPRCCAPSPRWTASRRDGDRGAGIDVVRAVLSDPLYWIASNAGYDGQAVVDQVRAMPDGHGLNALTGAFGDLFESGVVDPVRVTRLSLQNAASVAALMLTTEALVAEELIGQPGAIMAPGFGDLAEGMARPSSPV